MDVADEACIKRYVIGRSIECDIFVPSPRVSVRHAELQVQGFAGLVRDLGSRYGTTVNGRPVGDWTPFGQGDRITVGGSELYIDETGKVLENPSRPGATVTVAGLGIAMGRRKKQILRNMSFVVQPGEFVGLIGPSGSGKSTLLKTIVGLYEPSWGSVLINGIDLARDAKRARLEIGYVPQDDLVHADLTVREALRYGATMRLPLDTSPAEIESRTEVVMNDLGIAGAADTLIGSAERQGISGGQRKRVNLALELMSQPPLLLLDEPTSGLSSEDSNKVFKLLRGLADAGHTIIMTVHGPSLQEFQRLDLIVCVNDGELAYFGPAWPESGTYFAESVHERLGEKQVPTDEDAGMALRCVETMRDAGVGAEEMAQRYERSPYFQSYVAERLGGTDPQTEPARHAPPSLDWLVQFRNQIGRYLQLKLRNRGSLPIQLAQAPLVALLVILVFISSRPLEYPIYDGQGHMKDAPVLSQISLFMIIAAVWFGCSNAAREIVGERPVLVREKMIGLGVAAYLLSKIVVLAVLAAIQCLVILVITQLAMGWHLEPADVVLMFGLLWACAIAGTLQGLTVSALASSSESALSLTPLLLIPEILLSGAFTHVDILPTPLPYLSKLTVTRWAFDALLTLQGADPKNNCCGESTLGLPDAAYALLGLMALYLTVLVLRLAGSPRRFL